MISQQTTDIIQMYSVAPQQSIKISIHSYSEEANDITKGGLIDLKSNLAKINQQIAKASRTEGGIHSHQTHNAQGGYQGEGDYIHVGLKKAVDVFEQYGAKNSDRQKSLSSNTRRILHVITNSGVVTGKLNGADVNTEFK